MNLNVEIRDTKQNLTRIYNYEWGEDAFSDFLWSEGNYSCDCNRSLFFQRAAGKPEMEVLKSDESDPDYSDCNTGPNRFKLTICDDAGVVLYHED